MQIGCIFWDSTMHDRRAPNGENFLELIDRVRGGVHKLLADHGGRNIVIVAHGGTIRAALSIALAIPPQTILECILRIIR